MKHGNLIGKGRRFQRSIVPLAMPLMNLWIIEQRRRGILPWQNFRQQLCIAFEQRVDHLGHLTGYPTDDPLLSNTGVLTKVRASICWETT